MPYENKDIKVKQIEDITIKKTKFRFSLAVEEAGVLQSMMTRLIIGLKKQLPEDCSFEMSSLSTCENSEESMTFVLVYPPNRRWKVQKSLKEFQKETGLQIPL